MAESCSLVCVAGGQVYLDYAERLVESAREYFRPVAEMEYVILSGAEGWPDGTLLRYHRLMDALLDGVIASDWVYLIDADMLIARPVGEEIMPTNASAMALTLHPGYVGKPSEDLPFEDRSESACYVPLEKRKRYICGGFLGGRRLTVAVFAHQVRRLIDQDRAAGLTPRWNDESAVNRMAAESYAGDWSLELSPSYCFPEDPSFYEQHVWTERYEPKIIAVDKPTEHRGSARMGQ